ncbi:phosphotransferase enzyme family protein, partial [Rhizoctonia solani AG-3 Rhs1AP]
MNDLTTPQGVLAYLSNTCFAATNVQRIVGGFSSFTYRVTLSLPLEDGSTTLVLKHYEGYVAASPGFKLDSARSEFEYNALVALWDSGLVDGDSVVQVPRPIHYDRETHSIFLADLGSDIVNLNVMFDDRLQGAYSDPDLAEIQNVASTIGSALGDFLGREDLFKIFRDLAARSATKFGIKEEWLTNMLAEELRKSSTDDQVLVMGDFSLNNILVHRVLDPKKLRIYVIDWELCRPACPESDLGELIGTWLSFAHYRCIGKDFPFLPSFYNAYCKHHAVDRTRMTLQAGLYTMGLGTTAPWVRSGGDEIYERTTMLGYDLMKLAQGGDGCVTNTESPLKFLFD